MFHLLVIKMIENLFNIRIINDDVSLSFEIFANKEFLISNQEFENENYRFSYSLINDSYDSNIKFNKYDVFGEIFYRININNELFVKAREKSKILMFNYDMFERKCKKNCKFHEELLIGLPNLVLTKVSDLNLRIEILSQKTIRDKILSYFNNTTKKDF